MHTKCNCCACDTGSLIHVSLLVLGEYLGHSRQSLHVLKRLKETMMISHHKKYEQSSYYYALVKSTLTAAKKMST